MKDNKDIKKNKKIIKIKKNEEGDITHVMLENGEVVALNHAILMAKDYKINGVGVVRGKNGGEFLVPDPDVMSADKLCELPTFK